ncbi:EamA family transporter [Streptomyces sp. SID13666]|uniref:EamA family transporter n=1 Tax=Streptomyces sp. SID13666 TaxID=2706054 RepID=UPI0013BF5952|nr:EamA family transporter [Streptomyces sp. SID13666]NEA58102.1 EamA family transporter [Streptomyces sp. SID13666]
MSRLSTIALTALAPLAWGSTYAVTTQLLPPDRPLFAGLMRALPAGLVLLAATRALPRGAWWWKSAVLGTLNIGAFFPLLFLAAYRLPGGVASVVGSVGPLFVAGLAAALLSERPSARTLTAAVIGAVGVSLVVLRAGAGFDALGLLAGVAGSASMSAGTVLTKRWGRPEGVGPLAFTGWQLTAGGLLIAPVALLVEGLPPALDARAVTGYAYLAVANTAAAYWLWFRGIGRLPATSVSLLGFLSPLSAAAIGWAILDQSLTPVQLLGMAIAFTGTLLGQVHYQRRGSVAVAGSGAVSVPVLVSVPMSHQTSFPETPRISSPTR